MVHFKSQHTHWISLPLLVIILVVLYILSQNFYIRIDLTQKNRYSLSKETKHFLKKLKHDYEAEIFLNGELPYGFHKLQQATIELLKDLDKESASSISYTFPTIRTDDSKQIEELSARGLPYTSVNIKDKKGRLTQQLLFPALILHNKEKEVVIPLLQNNPSRSGQENLNQSIAGLEYELMNGLRMLERKELRQIAFLEGHGELTASQTIDFAKSLAENYSVSRTTADKIAMNMAALIIAQPRQNFSEEDKFSIDQYIMKGGKVVWLVDEVQVSKDSLRTNQAATAVYAPLNIEDQLFTYGVRINPQLVLDRNANLIKVNTALKGEAPRFAPLAWAYEPILETNPYHSITKGLSPVRAMFANSIDTLASQSVIFTPLLRTSTATRLESVPRMIRMREIQAMQQAGFYNTTHTNIAMLLEGSFTSVFKGRLAYTRRNNFKVQSPPNKMIVIADGDIIRNETRGVGAQMQFLPLGYNSEYAHTYGNKSFLLNAIDYLCEEEGWLALRNKEFTPAILNKTKARAERTFWQIVNIVLPLVFTLLIAIGYIWYRKRKYSN